MRHARSFLISCAFAASLAFGCAGNRAYVDWRPGLSTNDFDGMFELSLDEYDAFAERGEPNTYLDRFHGVAQPQAPEAMAELGERLAASSVPDPRGYALVSLTGEGEVELSAGQGRHHGGKVDWFATTADREWAALISGTKLAVVRGRSTTGVDVGSLLGKALGGYQLLMVIEGDELTVFALPSIGGAIAANEPGYIIAFEYVGSQREQWSVSVARVAVSL